jgi:hypothetical protein
VKRSQREWQISAQVDSRLATPRRSATSRRRAEPGEAFSKAFRPKIAPGRERSMAKRKVWLCAAALCTFVALYVASPYYALYRLEIALETGDRAALESTGPRCARG